MPDEQFSEHDPTITGARGASTPEASAPGALQTPPEQTTSSADARAYEQSATMREDDDWLEDRLEGLPHRPRRRLLAPLPLGLLGVLLVACGFIAGVLVEKGQGGSSSTGGNASGLASRLTALRSAGTQSGSSGAGAAGRGAGGGLFSAAGGSGAGATVGQVAYTSGRTLYVTDSEGNTVKVSTSSASTVTKTVTANVKQIHPGETVIVTGSAAKDGTIAAQSIRVSEAGGGLGALFGGGSGRALFGGGAGTGAAGGGAGASETGGGGGKEPALFGR